MLRRIIKIVAALAVVIPLAVVAAIPFIADEGFYGALVATPVAGDHADAILNRKQRIEATLRRYGDDIALNWESITGDDRGGAPPRAHTPRVVLALPAAPVEAPGADRGWTVKAEPKGDAASAVEPPPAPAIAPPPAVASRAVMAPPKPLDLAPPPPPLVGESEAKPAPKPTARKAAPPATRPAPPTVAPLAAASPRPESAPQPKAGEPAAKLTLPAAKAVKVPVSRRPAAPDESADQDHKRGMLFYKGIGVEKDFKKAAQWFRRAAEKGHAVAQYNLGIMTYLGQGVEQDYRQAAEWFRRAGEQDHAAAQYNLGFLYYEGKGVERDNLQAYMWIDRAASLGDDKAVKARDTLQKALPKDIFKQ